MSFNIQNVQIKDLFRYYKSVTACIFDFETWSAFYSANCRCGKKIRSSYIYSVCLVSTSLLWQILLPLIVSVICRSLVFKILLSICVNYNTILYETLSVAAGGTLACVTGSIPRPTVASTPSSASTMDHKTITNIHAVRILILVLSPFTDTRPWQHHNSRNRLSSIACEALTIFDRTWTGLKNLWSMAGLFSVIWHIYLWQYIYGNTPLTLLLLLLNNISVFLFILSADGYDFRLNEDVYWDAQGKYSAVIELIEYVLLTKNKIAC